MKKSSFMQLDRKRAARPAPGFEPFRTPAGRGFRWTFRRSAIIAAAKSRRARSEAESPAPQNPLRITERRTAAIVRYRRAAPAQFENRCGPCRIRLRANERARRHPGSRGELAP